MYNYTDMSDSYASSSNFTFPTSSTRDEQRPSGSSSAPRYDPLHRLVPDPPRPRLDPQYNHCDKPLAYAVAPGLQSDGTMTSQHPFVLRYLKQVHRVTPAEGRREPNEKWWTKGIRDPTVNEVLDLDNAELDDFQSDCVFVLAALKVLHDPRHEKHFAFWGREWAPRTAERVHKILCTNPCPIASSAKWISASQSLWLVDAAQAAAFPAKKEGKKANNGMLLRKRKAGVQAPAVDAAAAIAAAEGVPPKKRVRTTRGAVAAAEQEKGREQQEKKYVSAVEMDNGLLTALHLPDLTVSLAQPSTLSAQQQPQHTGRPMELELMGVDAPLPSSVIVSSSSSPSDDTTLLTSSTPATSTATLSPPEPTRRSVRQAHRRHSTSNANANAELSPTSDTGSLTDSPALPSVINPETRHAMTRARSSSSSCGSSTAVSELGLSGAETAAEVEVGEEKEVAKGSKRKRGLTAVLEEDAKPIPARASARVRKPAAKKVEAEEVVVEEQEKVGGGDGAITQKAAAAVNRKTTGRTRQRSTRRA